MKFMIHRTLGNIVQVDDEFWDDDKDLRPATSDELKANGYGGFIGESGADNSVVLVTSKIEMPNLDGMSKQDLNAFCVEHNLASSLAMNKPPIVLRQTTKLLIEAHNKRIDESNREVLEKVQTEGTAVPAKELPTEAGQQIARLAGTPTAHMMETAQELSEPGPEAMRIQGSFEQQMAARAEAALAGRTIIEDDAAAEQTAEQKRMADEQEALAAQMQAMREEADQLRQQLADSEAARLAAEAEAKENPAKKPKPKSAKEKAAETAAALDQMTG